MGRYRVPLMWLIERRIRRTDSCWEWTGEKNRWGYGRLSLERPIRQRFLAHRLVYEIYRGPIPKGLVLLHSCDNMCCVNPAHLTPGTQQENLADCRAKGRNRPRDKNAL